MLHLHIFDNTQKLYKEKLNEMINTILVKYIVKQMSYI